MKKGFTLIELLVVIAIVSLLSSVVLSSLNSAREKSRDARRYSDLAQIRSALELYRNDNGAYPVTANWRGECSSFGGYTADSVIPGLVPTYIKELPSDPSMTNPNLNCYVYRSVPANSGVDYKLLDYNVVAMSNPPMALVDPRRNTYRAWANNDPCLTAIAPPIGTGTGPINSSRTLAVWSGTGSQCW